MLGSPSGAQTGHDADADIHAAHAEHEGHDHDAAEGPDAHDEADDGHGHAEDEARVRLAPGGHDRFGVMIGSAGPATLENEVRLTGEIVLNEDRLVHVVPRVPGIARDVRASVGDRVSAGEILAVIDSAELAAAKLDYFEAVSELGCCQFELPRAQAIHDGALKMLELLESLPSLEELRESARGETGEYGSRLLSTYAAYVLAKTSYERERSLNAKQISSEGDFLAAGSAFKKAHAEYYGARDSVAFEVRQKLLEASKARQLAEFRAETAKQRLYMLGLTEEEVAVLAGPAPFGHGSDAADAHECADPDCTDCAAHGDDATASTGAHSRPHRSGPGLYAIRAPFAGVVLQRHITLGEHVEEDSEIFTVADTSSVWADLAVHARNLAAVRPGLEVALRADHDGIETRGVVAMVTPFVEAATRSATARIVLDNADGRWRPGTFVTGLINDSVGSAPVAVPRDAVQNIDGRDVVFVEHEDGFEATPVTLGRTDGTHAEIVAGLQPGTRYAAAGAFHLKATLITSDLGAHAGHGH
jgi:multidrug efflux pump subunit AcrA (membrane-fusion protein)